MWCIETDDFFASEPIQLCLIVTNVGNAQSTPCQVGIRGIINNTALPPEVYLSAEKIILPGLEPNTSLEVTLDFETPVAGTYTLWADVDLSQEVRETDESNNSVSTSFEALERPKPMVILFQDDFEGGLIKPQWIMNRSASGFFPSVALDSSPNAVSFSHGEGRTVLYMGDWFSRLYSHATAELTFNLSAYSEAFLEFDWAAFSLSGNECIRLDIYDGRWHNDVRRFNQEHWQAERVSLQEFRMVKNFRIRFRSWMDYPEHLDAAYLDNVAVMAR